jgi:hypothetical protein
MSETKQPRLGIKIDQSIKDQLDKNRLPVTKAAADEEVSGQYYYDGWTQCPYCGYTGWTGGLNSDYYINVQCGNCWSVFLA